MGGVALGLVAGQAIADVCAGPGERAAVATRVFQTELMVAALRCDERGNYNAFVRKFENDLVDGGKTLRMMFSRTYGNSGSGELSSFVTRLANEASLRSLDAGDAYCAQAAELFGRVMIADRKDFSALVEARAGAETGIDGCLSEASRSGPAGRR